MSVGRGWQWDKVASAFKRHSARPALPCARCHLPIDYTLQGNDSRAFTAGHIDGFAWDDLPPDDPRRLDPVYLQPEHRGCGATAGNHHRQGLTTPAPTSRSW